MQRYSITVETVTQALKGREVLRKNGFRASVKKSTSDSENMGCAYNIVLEGGELSKAIRILHKSGITVKSVR